MKTQLNLPDWLKMLIAIVCVAFIISISLLLAGCKTQQPQVVEKIVTNTEYIDRHHYDSIFKDKVVYVDRGSDTIKMYERVVEYQYKFLTDSIEILRVDSIPYEVRVVEVVAKMNNHQRTMYWIGWSAIALVVAGAIWKVYKKFKI